MSTFTLLEGAFYLEGLVPRQLVVARPWQGLRKALLQLVLVRAFVHLAYQHVRSKVRILIRVPLYLVRLDLRAELHAGVLGILARCHRLDLKE